MASAVSMDKIISKKLFMQGKILTPQFIVIEDKKIDFKQIKDKIGLPCVINPSNSGSSVGVSIIKSGKEIKKWIKTALKEAAEIAAKKAIKNCGSSE